MPLGATTSSMHPLMLFLAALSVAGGAVATYSYDQRSWLASRVAAGTCTAFAVVGLVGFLLAAQFRLSAVVVTAALAIAACPICLLLFERYRRAVSSDVLTALQDVMQAFLTARFTTVAKLAAAGTGIVLLWRVADRSMVVLPDGIYTGIAHNYGDLPFHLSVIARFVLGNNFPPEHPSLAGVSFTYPFLTDFLAAMFVKTGASMRDVIVWPTFLLCVAFGVLLHQWTFEFTASRNAALLAPVLAFLSGGLGWWRLVDDAHATEVGMPALLARLPHDYTITADTEFRWGNLVSTLLVPQRGLLLALPLALIVFRLWWLASAAEEQGARTHRPLMIAAGLFAGVLPLIHGHSFVVLIGLGVCLTVLSKHRLVWLPFFMWSLALGLPQLWWMVQSSSTEATRFLDWSFGWDHGDRNVFTFWLKNTGLFIPLTLAAVLWRGRQPLLTRSQLLFYLPFSLCFIGPNLLRLAPWIWDNIKVLAYWLVASVPLVALVLARLASVRPWGRAIAATSVVMLTLAGGLDLWRIASRAVQLRVFDSQALEFAKVVEKTTGVTALILHAPIHNHPVALSGRRSFMGYPGHVWSHGLNPGTREADIRKMYQGGAESVALMRAYAIDYVVVGPPERAAGLAGDLEFFEGYPIVAEIGGYQLYRTGGDHD
jgi:hypothetical protein